MRNLTVDLLETFKTDGLPEDMADTSKATAVAKLRCFLRTAYRRDWISQSLVDKVTPHRAVYEQKEPYSDEEVERILDEALKLNGGTHGYPDDAGLFHKHPRDGLRGQPPESGQFPHSVMFLERDGGQSQCASALGTDLGEVLWIHAYL